MQGSDAAKYKEVAAERNLRNNPAHVVAARDSKPKFVQIQVHSCSFKFVQVQVR